MVSVMTTRLPSSPVAHAGGKQCEHLTGTQTCYPASTSSGGSRPKPHLEGRKDFRTMSGVLELREVVLVTPLEDPEAWPVYGSLISDAQSAVRELDSARSRAVLPTDNGRPIRAPQSALIWGWIRWRARHRGPGHLSTVDCRSESGEVAAIHEPGC